MNAKSVDYNRFRHCLIVLIPFGILLIITVLFFPNDYLFEYALSRAYLFLWVIAGVLAYSRPILGYTISLANFFGVIGGQFLGDILRKNNLAKITPDMDPGQVAHLWLHRGFQIWIFTVLSSIALYFIISLLMSKLKKEK